MSELTLSQEEIIEVTGFKLASKQIAFFKEIGIDAKRRRDNTVFVNRFAYMAAANARAPEQAAAPKLKSMRR